MSYKQTIETVFDKNSLNLKKIDIRSKTLGPDLISKRNVIARYLSDYISEHIGLGRTVSSTELSLFSNPKSAPDASIDINTFETLTGITVKPTTITNAPANLAFFETKVTGLGESADIQFTSTTIPRTSKQFQTIQQFTATTETSNIIGNDAIELLFSRAFTSIRKNLIANTSQKIENLLLIDIADKDKTPGVSLKFIPNTITKASLANKQNFSKYYSVRIRPRTNNGEIVSYRVDISTTAALQEQIKKRAKDITDKILLIHEKGISDSLFDNLLSRIKKAGYSGNDLNEYLALAISIANEFKKGGHTPFVIESTIELPTLSSTSATLKLTGSKKAAIPTNTQKFISSAQWTYLTQKRLGDTMLHFGNPNPPDLKERSGRFRKSVEVTANYKANLLQYEYNPLYSSLATYGYRPDLQIERSIRDVARQLYAREFNITRKAGF